MILGMCLGILDEKIGPTSIYHLNLSEELSKKLAMKIMIGVMSFSSETSESDLRGESVIPFLKEKIITISYLFPIKDAKARGGFRQCSIIIAFDIDDRRLLYENATDITRLLRTISEIIELKHIQNKNFPISISVKYDMIRSMVFSSTKKLISKDKSMISITCPICTNSKEIEMPLVTKGLKFIEHQIFEKEVCEHAFTVYLDSKFNILGYKDTEVEVSDMKNMFSKLKSPYDK
ncbi:MAG: hypothetical protein ACTSSH_01995 [Candidatus Heimdallarchaeota archaeon]